MVCGWRNQCGLCRNKTGVYCILVFCDILSYLHWLYFTDQTVRGDSSLHHGGGGGRDAPQHQGQGEDLSSAPLSLGLELNT